MPQFQSQLGHIGLAKQTALGSPVTNFSTATWARWFKARSSSVGPDRELMFADPEIQGANGRDYVKPVLGPVSITGDYEAYVRSEALPLLFYAALGGGGGAPTQPGGAPTPTTATGYEHVFTPADTLPYFTIEEKQANGYETVRYRDCVVNSFHLECPADGFFTASFGIFGRDMIYTPLNTGTPAFDGTPLYVGSMIDVVWNGASVKASQFSFDFSNNAENDYYRLGSNFVDQFTPKRRDITGSFTFRPENNTLSRVANPLGAGANDIPMGTVVTVDDLVITATHYEIIGGATSAVYKTILTMGETVLKPVKPEFSGDDSLELSIDFQAIKASGTNALEIKVNNGVSAQYAASS